MSSIIASSSSTSAHKDRDHPSQISVAADHPHRPHSPSSPRKSTAAEPASPIDAALSHPRSSTSRMNRSGRARRPGSSMPDELSSSPASVAELPLPAGSCEPSSAPVLGLRFSFGRSSAATRGTVPSSTSKAIPLVDFDALAAAFYVPTTPTLTTASDVESTPSSPALPTPNMFNSSSIGSSGSRESSRSNSAAAAAAAAWRHKHRRSPIPIFADDALHSQCARGSAEADEHESPFAPDETEIDAVAFDVDDERIGSGGYRGRNAPSDWSTHARRWSTSLGRNSSMYLQSARFVLSLPYRSSMAADTPS